MMKYDSCASLTKRWWSQETTQYIFGILEPTMAGTVVSLWYIERTGLASLSHINGPTTTYMDKESGVSAVESLQLHQHPENVGRMR
jgi:hypothetical protein